VGAPGVWGGTNIDGGGGREVGTGKERGGGVNGEGGIGKYKRVEGRGSGGGVVGLGR